MRHVIHTIVVICATLTLGACSRADSPVVATVGGKPITAAQLVSRMKMAREKYDPVLLRDKANFGEFRQQTLKGLIDEQLFLWEADRVGIVITPEEMAEHLSAQRGEASAEEMNQALRDYGIDAEDWEETQRRRLAIQKLIQQEVIDAIPVSDEEVAAYYRKHIQDFRLPTQFHARQILVDSRETAEEIHAKLKRGEDFAKLARAFSMSPDAQRGGDLGLFDARTYPEMFITICQRLQIGEISKVLDTDYGYQIFQLLDRRPPRQRSLGEVTDAIRLKLREQRSEAAFATWVEKITNQTTASIDQTQLKGVTLDAIP